MNTSTIHKQLIARFIQINRKVIGVIACGVMLFGGSCISEYTPKDIDNVRDLLVVEGMITNDTTHILLSKSVGITESFKKDNYIYNATIAVESSDGERFEGYHASEGSYVIPNGKLDVDKSYRLSIKYNSEQYESSFLTPLITPEIDSIGVMKAGKGEEVFITVTTHDAGNQTAFYKWSYKETWEFKAEMYANARLTQHLDTIFHSLRTSENTYYCWNSEHSKSILLGNTTKLQENVVSNHKLLSMPPSSEKLSIMYHIHVTQNQIRKETYDYISNMQKNGEDMGGLFAPIPSEMQGNVTCVSNPDIRTIGFVDVSVETSKGYYVPQEMGYYEAPRFYCSSREPVPVVSPELILQMGYAILDLNTLTGDIEQIIIRSCVDCTLSGTKKKPKDWPTTHL